MIASEPVCFVSNLLLFEDSDNIDLHWFVKLNKFIHLTIVTTTTRSTFWFLFVCNVYLCGNFFSVVKACTFNCFDSYKCQVQCDNTS